MRQEPPATRIYETHRKTRQAYGPALSDGALTYKRARKGVPSFLGKRKRISPFLQAVTIRSLFRLFTYYWTPYFPLD